jgi:hypothetical protein
LAAQINRAFLVFAGAAGILSAAYLFCGADTPVRRFFCSCSTSSDQSKARAAPLNDSPKCRYGRTLLLTLAPLALTSIRSLLVAER